MKAGPSPAIRAEQALLGAVLLDPAGQAHLLSLVQPGDMTRPFHGQLLAAMQRLREQGVPPGPMAVHEEVKKDPDLPAGVSHDGVLLADLMEAAPRAGHAPAYAAMVIGGGIRQRMALRAARMSQAARGGDPAVALRMAALARAELDRCQARWQALPEQIRRELPLRTQDRRGHTDVARQLNAARDEIRRLRHDLELETQHRLEEQLALIAERLAGAAAASTALRERQATVRAAGEARPRGPGAQAAGAQALRDLAASPSQLHAVRGWLRPGHFACPEHGELYAVMRDLAAAGQPVDPVTVSWEASRRGVAVDAVDLADGMGPLAVASAREVHRRGLLAQMDQAGRDIQASASEPAVSTAGFLRSAHDHLARLEPGPARWPSHHAGSLPADPARQHDIPAASRQTPAEWEPVHEAAS